jgi:hypothetical protein
MIGSHAGAEAGGYRGHCLEEERIWTDRRTKNPTALIPGWVWWLVLIGLVVWNVSSLRQTAQPQADIPYSLFLTQVHNGNVVSITLNGDQITGPLAQAIIWPRPTATASASAAAGANAPPAPKASSGGHAHREAVPMPYLQFRTLFLRRSAIPLS